LANTEGKESFYPKVFEALISNGYKVVNAIQGKGRSHASKPDYIAFKESRIVIGEIKSPSEGPRSTSWRIPQISDTEEFVAVRLDVDAREKRGLFSKETGGHEIIIRGQIPDYLRKLGKSYDLPAECPKIGRILGGYSAPAEEAENIEQALSNCGKVNFVKIMRTGTTTYLFSI
jgi:hypothetical protein